MKNIDIAEHLYKKIEDSDEFLVYKNRWKNYFLILPVLFFIFSLFLVFFKFQGFINQNVSLNPLFMINIASFFVFMHSYYGNSHDSSILNFYSKQKDNLNTIEKFVLETYLEQLLKNSSIFQHKKSHFLYHIENILNNLSEKSREEIDFSSNLDNF